MPRNLDALDASSASTDTDSSLLALVQGGDSDAMARLFARHSKLVYSVALRVLHDPAAAEDVLQEIFLQIWRTPSSFVAVRGSFQGWLAVVSRNRAIDVLRAKKPADSVDDLPVTSRYDLSEEAERNVMLERVKGAMAALPEEQRKTLELAYFEGCSHSEIAAKTGYPLGTVKTRLKGALQTLGSAFRA